MDTRERFLKIMRFQRADRLPIIQVEGVEGPTMARWHREGLPEGMDQQQYLVMDRLEFVAVDLHMLPRFAVRVLEETADYTIEISDVGIKTRYDKRHRGYL